MLYLHWSHSLGLMGWLNIVQDRLHSDICHILEGRHHCHINSNTRSIWVYSSDQSWNNYSPDLVMIGAYRQYHQCPHLGKPWQRTLQKHVSWHKVSAVLLVDSYRSDWEGREEKTHMRDEMGKGPVVVCYDARPSNGIYTFMLRWLQDKYDRKRLNVK